MTDHADPPATRARLLDAAGEVFGQKGFHAASVREICERARANVAAVNYHFGDKESLYEAVVLQTFRHALEAYPPEPAGAASWPVEERLFAFVHSFLLRRLDPARPAWHHHVLRREFFEPGPALRAAVEKVIRNHHDRLRALVGDVLGPKANEERRRFTVASILGQCLFYGHGQHIIERLHGGVDTSPAGIERLARHITAFSLAGMREQGEQEQKKRRETPVAAGGPTG